MKGLTDGKGPPTRVTSRESVPSAACGAYIQRNSGKYITSVTMFTENGTIITSWSIPMTDFERPHMVQLTNDAAEIEITGEDGEYIRFMYAGTRRV